MANGMSENVNVTENSELAGRPPLRRAAKIALGVVFVLSAGILVFTDSSPSVDTPSAPSAEQASAARAAVSQLRSAQRIGGSAARISLTVGQLEAFGILASDAFRPDRMQIRVIDERLEIDGSHRLFFGRWLNAGLSGKAGGQGFPQVKLRLGPVTFPEGMSRFVLQTGRMALNLVGTNIPPLDQLISSSTITGGKATAMVRLPRKSGLLDMFGPGELGSDALAVRTTFCRLSAMQAKSPTDDFHILVHRAFPRERVDVANVTTNRAALVALAMMSVSPQVGQLVGLSTEEVEGCQTKSPQFRLKNRNDLPKHWSLSAALAVTTGSTLSESIGEWKELADSVSSQSEFARGDPTGFSFLDIAADRSGFFAGREAMDSERSRAFATAMAHISEENLLPSALMAFEDGMPAAEFRRKYGSISDPRFHARIKQIDTILDQRDIVGQTTGNSGG